MPINKHYVIITIISLIGVVCIFYLSNALITFIFAFILSYLLNPLINGCEKYLKTSRLCSTTIIFALGVICICSILIILIPALYKQISLFVVNIPKYKSYIQESLIPSISEKLYDINPHLSEEFNSLFEGFTSRLFNDLSFLINSLWDYTIATVNILMLLLFVPIISFYLLLDWKMIKDFCYQSTKQNKSLTSFIDESNTLLNAYVRGQLQVCLLLSAYYIIGLSLINMDLFLLVGLMSGFFIIVPFIGSIISFTVAVFIAMVSYGMTDLKSIYVVCLYIIGYLIEGYYLTPHIIGNKIGLHPVWIMFALLIGGELFGLIGMILSVPIAGIIKIIIQILKK